jgi:hypothetical protein
MTAIVAFTFKGEKLSNYFEKIITQNSVIIFFKKICFENDPYKDNLMRGIVCAHSQTLKMLP